MNLSQIVERNVKRIPHWPAVISENLKLTWQEFNQQINKLANSMRKLGVIKGDRVAR